MIPPYLLDAYRRAEYHVFNPPFMISVGGKCAPLDDLLKKHGQKEWAFITAYNPASNILPDTENDHRHEQLLAALHLYTYFEGAGVGENPPWKPERSLLVIGIRRSEAVALGKQFGQYAILAGSIHSTAELLLLE